MGGAESSAGILPAVGSATRARGWRDARRTAAGTAALLETEQHGFGLQLDFPLLLDPGLDFVFQLDYFGGSGASAIDDGERMLARDPHVSISEALGETGLLHQPRRRNFPARCERGIVGNFQTPLGCFPLQRLELVLRKHWILEERSRTSCVRIAGREQHPFACSDLPHSFPHFGQRGFCSTPKVLLQVRVGYSRMAVMYERIGNAQNHVAPASARVENAAPVTKSAIGFFELLFFAVLDIKCDHGVDRLGNFLSICPDILDRRAPHAAWNSAQALDASTAMLNRCRDKRIPILARSHIEVGGAVTMAVVDSQERNLQH